VDVATVPLFVMVVAGWWADQRQASVAYLIDEKLKGAEIRVSACGCPAGLARAEGKTDAWNTRI
jgi:hypothetical protein